MSSERIVYDKDIYEETNVERGSVENVVFDANKYIVYVQWHSGMVTIYAYNCTVAKWDEFVSKVNKLKSVGSALHQTHWGASFETYAGWDTEFSKRAPVLSAAAAPVGMDEFQVTINFTGTITVKVAADDLPGAIRVACAMFDNEATDGTVEILEAKKVT